MMPLLPVPTIPKDGEVVVSYYTPEQMYEYGRKVQEEERIRCGLIAETYPFSPMIGGQIAARIYRGGDES